MNAFRSSRQSPGYLRRKHDQKKKVTFSIQIIDARSSNRVRYQIRLGDNVEEGYLITTRWSCDEYSEQWKTALTALTQGKVLKCVLITDVQPEYASFGIMYWALFRDEQDVIFQERFLRKNPEHLLGSPEIVEPHIPHRVQGSPEEHALVSEWSVPLAHINSFVTLGFRSDHL